MIRIRGLTRRYGSTLAVDHLSFDVRPGVVTGFLGPNGAGKSTTMRVILGLDTATEGTVTVAGRRYGDLPAPMRTLGALLDAGAVHPHRTAEAHLLCLARSNGISRRRVGEVLDLVGLSDVAGRRVGKFSLGMRQRLGIAATLLGDPPGLLLDEPVNGLDPEGVHWFRELMRDLARQGRAVLVSSHLMAEMALTADHLIVIGRGRLIADTATTDFIASTTDDQVLVRAAVAEDAQALRKRLESAGAVVEPAPGGGFLTGGLDATRIGLLAAAAGLALGELTPQRSSLEEAFMEATKGSVQFRASTDAAPDTEVWS